MSEAHARTRWSGLFGQGYKSMSLAVRDLETLILERKLRHGSHPVLTMCIANSPIERGDAGNRKLPKKRSDGPH